jgi:hypothetical protein
LAIAFAGAAKDSMVVYIKLERRHGSLAGSAKMFDLIQTQFGR